MSTPSMIWRICAPFAFLLFYVWARLPKLPYRGFAACVGAIICFISLAALTEVTRRYFETASTPAVIAIYVVGIGFSIIVSGFYAFFFTFLYVKNF